MIKCAGSYKETTALGKPELQSYIVLTLVGYSPNRDWDLQICEERECSSPCVPRIRIYFPEVLVDLETRDCGVQTYVGIVRQSLSFILHKS